MKPKRPTHLNLFLIKFSIAAKASGMHRLSGLLLLFFIPTLLWMLQMSFASPQDFSHLQEILSGIVIKFVLWVFLAGLIYHIFAGIRHLLLDAGIGESDKVARFSGAFVIALSFLFIMLTGGWLWQMV